MKHKADKGNTGKKPVLSSAAKPGKMGKSHMNTPGVKKASC